MSLSRWRQLLLLLSAVPAAHAAGKLEITQVQLSFSEDGPPADADFQPGENVFLSFLVSNYKISPLEKVQLSYTLKVNDSRGVPIISPVHSRLEAGLAPQDKDWRPKIREVIGIPPIAPGGSYPVHITVTDEAALQTVEKDLTIPVKGPRPSAATADGLSVREFGFYRGENDAVALPTPIYGPGATVYARFEIAGYKYGKDNQVEVSYGVALLNSEGKSLYSKADAATERTSGLYPQPWVPAGMTLNLDKNIAPGEYTLVLSLHDAIGGQTAESRHAFRVQ